MEKLLDVLDFGMPAVENQDQAQLKSLPSKRIKASVLALQGGRVF